MLSLLKQSTKVQLYYSTVTYLLTKNKQEGLAVASILRDVVVEMTPPLDDNAR